MRNTGRLAIVILAVATGPLFAQNPWPPDVSVNPRNPITLDTITLTISDVWSHDNIPGPVSSTEVRGHSIYVTLAGMLYVTINYWSTPWEYSCSTGPLAAGCYDVYVAEAGFPDRGPMKAGTFCVSSTGGVTLALADGDFEASRDSADLRTNAAEQDWYESRKDMPTLVTLDTTVVGIDDSHKAKLTASSVGSTYLTQEFSSPQSGQFSAQWDIYVDSIFNASTNPDRAGWMLIGDDTGTTPERIGPNAEDSERFVYMAFYKNGGGTTGKMDLVARDRDDTWTAFTTVARGLNLKQWYTIKVDVDVAQGTYDVYVNGEFKATVTSRMPKSRVTHISFAQWDDGPGTFYVDHVSTGVEQGPPRLPGMLLADCELEASTDSAALRANGAGEDWYESRQDVPDLLTLTSASVGGDITRKAKLSASTTGSAYLTQTFSPPQTRRFQVQWSIYVDSIVDSPTNPDCAGWMLIGDDSGTDPSRIGPNAEDSERFVYMAFAKNGGGTTGTMDLVARDNDDAWTGFTTIATGLKFKQWYTIRVVCDLDQDDYEVYVGASLYATVKARTPKSRLTHISFAQWADGPGTFYVDNVAAWVEQTPPAGGDDTDAKKPFVLSFASCENMSRIHIRWSDDGIHWTDATHAHTTADWGAGIAANEDGTLYLALFEDSFAQWRYLMGTSPGTWDTQSSLAGNGHFAQYHSAATLAHLSGGKWLVALGPCHLGGGASILEFDSSAGVRDFIQDVTPVIGVTNSNIWHYRPAIANRNGLLLAAWLLSGKQLQMVTGNVVSGAPVWNAGYIFSTPEPGFLGPELAQDLSTDEHNFYLGVIRQRIPDEGDILERHFLFIYTSTDALHWTSLTSQEVYVPTALAIAARATNDIVAIATQAGFNYPIRFDGSRWTNLDENAVFGSPLNNKGFPITLCAGH